MRHICQSRKVLNVSLKAFITVQMMTKQVALGGHLVFELLIESEPVLWFPIWHFVSLEPINRGLQITRFQALDITDV